MCFNVLFGVLLRNIEILRYIQEILLRAIIAEKLLSLRGRGVDFIYPPNPPYDPPLTKFTVPPG